MPKQKSLFELRRQMHCQTCGKPWYPPTKIEHFCRCDTCNCLYCREYKIPLDKDSAFMALAIPKIENLILGEDDGA